jgi:hypothetical protein
MVTLGEMKQSDASIENTSGLAPKNGLQNTSRDAVTTFFFFFSFLMTQQTHVTMYDYFLTRSCDSLVQIRTDDSFSLYLAAY